MNDSPSRGAPRPAYRLLTVLAIVGAVAHLVVLTRYGWFRDELYYLACARHLDFGYVDHPPGVALVAWAVRSLFGETLWALRLPSVVAGSLTVLVTGLTAREMGGGRFAQGIAAAAVLPPPIYLFFFHVLSMNSIDILAWTTAGWLLARMIRTGDQRLWLAFGTVAGLGLQNKHSVLFFGFAVLAALVVGPQRRWLASRWPWLGAGVAGVLLLPNVVWQALHSWPTLEFAANAAARKHLELSPLDFLGEQLLLMGPATLPVWVAGLVWGFFPERGRRFRLLPLAWLFLFGLFVAQNAKAYYLAPAYPLLFAGGGVAWERLAGLRRFGWVRGAIIACLVVLGGAIAPFGLPVLDVPTFARYQEALGITASSGERHELATLPQHYADMHGWPELAETVVGVAGTLAPSERDWAVVVADNYGEAGALEHFAGSRLPRVISAHNSYHSWGYGDGSAELAILLGGSREQRLEIFEEVELAATFRCAYCMPYENDLPIWIGRRPKQPLAELWPLAKHYI